MTTSSCRPWPATPTAISYFGYAYYVQNQDKVKAVAIDGGKGCVAPTPTTIDDGTYSPLSRPLFIYPNTGKAKASPALYAFVSFYLANAATLATEPTIGYIAVPAVRGAAAAGQLELRRPAVDGVHATHRPHSDGRCVALFRDDCARLSALPA